MGHLRLLKPSFYVSAFALLLLLLTLACGAKATPAPQPTATRAPAATASPTATTAPAATSTPAATATPRPTAAPSPTATPTPTPTATPGATPTNVQGLTSESIGRGAGNVKGIVNIEAGKTDLRVGRNTLAPGGYINWHYSNGPFLAVVEKGTATFK